MKRMAIILVFVAVVAVLVGIAWWVVGRSAWQPPAPVRPALPEIAQTEPVSAAGGKAALEAPLFWTSRAPVESGEVKVEVAPESEMSRMRLMAVLESGGQRVALLQRADRSVLKLDSAEPNPDWRLESFDGVTAVFVSRDGQRVERPLEKTPGSSTTPPRSKPAVGRSAAARPAPSRSVPRDRPLSAARPHAESGARPSGLGFLAIPAPSQLVSPAFPPDASVRGA